MKREEKERLYDFLETARRYLSGGAEVRRAPPEFEDELDGPTLTARILACERCDLAKTRANVVPGAGVDSPLVMVIGEGPGADEDASGLPFVGKAGQLLDRMLASIGISRETNAFVANIVKCRPPNNRDPEPSEIACCLPWLEAQIALRSPVAILALGRVAARTLLGVSTPMGSLHGAFHEYRGIPLMPTYHPSALLRDESLKRPAWEDLKSFRERLMKVSPAYRGTNEGE